jgi:hypothetical protein
MSNVRSQPLESRRCEARTSLTTTEAAKLRVISTDVPAPNTSLPCEIAAGHDGDHLALAAVSDGDELWWWLCWGLRVRQVRQIDLCDGRDLDDPYLDDCLLPEGHPRPHSYQIRVG